MRILALMFALSGCATSPVTLNHWVGCLNVCEYEVKEACVGFFKGPGCTCWDNKTIWLDEYEQTKADSEKDLEVLPEVFDHTIEEMWDEDRD